MKRVVIVGMGFGGLRAARVLSRSADIEVLVIDQRNYHLFQPLLYQVATASLDQESIAYPIREVIRQWRNTRFLFAGVTGVDLEQCIVQTDRGAYPYDYLIVACGSVSNFYGNGDIERHALVLKYLDDAVTLRNRILDNFELAAEIDDHEKRLPFLTFVVVGAGPTGVELCGALADLVYRALPRDYPGLPTEEARIVLVEALGDVLPSFPAALQRYAYKRLDKLGVEIRLSSPVIQVRSDCVVFKDGSELQTRTFVWTAGVQAAPLVTRMGLPTGRNGRVVVQPDLSVQGHPEVFVVGDAAYVEHEGQALAMVAPVALQQGEHAGQAILRQERGGPVQPFRYRDRGTMAIIGRYAAVAMAYGVAMRGFVAWMAWLALHLYYLVGFRNRLIALLNWVYAYLFVNPRIRLITRDTHAMHADQERGDGHASHL